MKDLRIVIVSWNVEKLLDRCLATLPRSCEGLDWECVVVDNASQDESLQIAKAWQEKDMRFSVIDAKANLGFAKACNLGTKGFDSRYVLFLNPDTECLPNTLAQLVSKADACPKAGIIGPKLIYPDGRFQESIRRFPTVWSQAGILLKLHHVLKFLPTFKKYFAKDLDSEQEQDVDQVMGACFLVRRELIDQHLGFDERFFIWFEEVDFCKMATKNGWTVRYIPSVSIIHVGGQSFSQVFSPSKQRYLDTSLIAYFKKWHPVWQVRLLQAIHPIAMAQAYMIRFLRSTVGRWISLLFGLEMLSLAVFRVPILDTILAVAVAVMVLLVAWKRPALALCFMLLELLVGSKGALLQIGVAPHVQSLRILITGAFLIGWFFNAFQNKALGSSLSRIKTYWPYFLVYLMIVYGFVRGWMLGNHMYLFADGNAWLDLVLLFPILDVVSRERETFKKNIPTVLIVGVLWLAIESLLVEYLFSHAFPGSSYLYSWIRRTGVGEITLIVGNFFRIFLQSQIYPALSIITSASYLVFSDWKTLSRVQLRIAQSLLMFSAASLFLSLSRSLWVGVLPGLACIVLIAWNKHALSVKKWLHIFGSLFAGVLLGIFVVIIPLPPVDITSLSAVLGSRTDSEGAAVVSRWSLLSVLETKISEHPILGSGFGATVTYETKDPRIVSETGGTYTTYAFEWGWLEHWIKFGIVGIPLLAGVLIWLGMRLWRSNLELWMRVAAVVSLVTLATIHAFTPYLNHPLGFACIFFAEGLLVFYGVQKKA